MTTIHAQFIGSQVLLPRSELERLLEIARQADVIELEVCDQDTPTMALMQLTEQGRAFDFWKEPGENIYTVQDGGPL